MSTDKFTHPDGTVHFSDLKKFAQSPAHYRHSVTHPIEPTRPMRIGSLVDMMLLTYKQPCVWPGTRSGSEWGLFKSANAGREIYTTSELADAQSIVAAAIVDPIAHKFLGLGNRYRLTQASLSWESNGVPRSTRGVDVLTDGMLVDLKVSHTTNPSRMAHHARRMMWHAQLADYAEACRQNGIPVPHGLYILGIESKAPHCVTALRMTPEAIEEGDRCVAMWIEQYKVCRESNRWPGYAQSACDMMIDSFEGAELGEENVGDE